MLARLHFYPNTGHLYSIFAPPRRARAARHQDRPHTHMMNNSELMQAALYSRAAYAPQEFGGLAKKFHTWYSSTTFYFLPKNDFDDRNWIVFKGSTSLPDALIDIGALPVYYQGNWVHGGFAYAHPKKKLRKILKNIEGPLYLTGHSLGAIQSELTLLLVQREFPWIDCKCVCFGKPRGFKKPLKTRFKKDSIFSVVSSSDLVTRLPRYLFTYGCKDQNLFYLDSDGAGYLNPDYQFVIDDFNLARSLSDHSMNQYIEVIKKIT